ncbi:hypothetical protein BDR26DRAFT_530896 [Obelidium mucronatum]|nr:hypothetical protein BDR26DRAFT_530896 [Obelidium mucronatum]
MVNQTVSPASKKVKRLQEKAEKDKQRARAAEVKLALTVQKKKEQELKKKEAEEKRVKRAEVKAARDAAAAAATPRTVWHNGDKLNAILLKQEAKELHVNIRSDVPGFVPEGKFMRDYFAKEVNRERFHLSQFTGEQIETQLKNLLTLYKKIRDLCAMTGGGGLHDTLGRYDMSLGVYDALGDLYQDNPAVNIRPLRKSGWPHAVDSSSDDGDDNGGSNGQERSNRLVEDAGGDADSYDEQDGEAEANTIQAVSSVATPVGTSVRFPPTHSSVTDNSSSSSSRTHSSSMNNRRGLPPLESPKPAKKSKTDLAEIRRQEREDRAYESERSTNEMIKTMMAQQMQAQTAQQQMFTQLLQVRLPVFLGYMGSHTNQAAIPPPVQQQSIQHGWPPMPNHEFSSSQQTQQPHRAQQYQTPLQQPNPTIASTNSHQAAEQETEESEN